MLLYTEMIKFCCIFFPCNTRYDILNPSDRPSPVLSPSRSFLGEPKFWLPPAQHDRVQRTPAYPPRRPLLPVRPSLLPLSNPLGRQLPLRLCQPPGGAVRLQEDCLRPPYSTPERCGYQMLVSRQRERPSLYLPGRLVWTSCGWWDLHLRVFSHSCIRRGLLQLLWGLPVWPLRNAVGACGLILRERKLFLMESLTWELWSTNNPPFNGLKRPIHSIKHLVIVVWRLFDLHKLNFKIQ